MNKIKETNNNNNTQKKIFSFNDVIAVGIFTLYLSVDFVPTFGSYTFADSQWLYLTILNFFVGFYIYYNKMWVDNLIFKSFFLSKVIVLYIVFLLICGISIAVGLNFDEGFITLLRYLVTFSSFFLLFVLFYNKCHTFLTLACIISILIFVECLNGLKVIFQNYGLMSFREMISSVKHHHDNTNIFSSNILIKVPFIVFCVIKTVGWRRLLFGFILLISFITILFLGSRSMIAGLLLQIFVFFVGFFVLKFYKIINLKWNFSIVILILIFCAIALNNLNLINNEKKLYNINTKISFQKIDKNATYPRVDNSQIFIDLRKLYWEGALETIKNKPLLGCGLGNWKLESIRHELKWKPNNINGVHAHNDFLQVAAETGILNGIVFFLIFISMIFVNLKTIFKYKNAEQSLLAILLLASIIGLMVDTFFNFPLSRPTIQILFVILILFSLLNYFQFENNTNFAIKTNFSKNTIFVVLMLSFASIYPNYLIFKFYKAIKVAKEDASTLNLSYKEIDILFKDFPLLDEIGTPVVDLKVNYLLKENKFKKALELIDKSVKISPYSVYSNSLRVDLYNKKKEYDSAVFYAKKVYDLQPNYQVFYERYVQGLSRLKDTLAIIKAFKNLDDYKINANHYSATFGCLLKAGYGKSESFEFIKQGLSRFPDDSNLQEININFNKKTKVPVSILNEKELQINASKTNDYREIEKFYIKKYANNKLDFSVVENLGICYFQQKKYTVAIKYLNKVVEANAFQNGKSEYVLSVCYENLNNKKMACKMANLALQKNFQDAKNIIQNNCN